MHASRHQGIIRLFFILQQLGVLILLWTIYPLVNWLRFDGALGIDPYREAGLLLFASALLEIFTRDPESRAMSGLSRQRLASISHRQTLFALVTIFGTMVMLKDDSLSRVFLASFFTCYFAWIYWTNQFGFRLLHRALYRNGEKGNTGAVLIGAPADLDRFCANSESPKTPGTDIVGYIPVPAGPDMAVMQIAIPRLGDLADIRKICEETRARALLLLGLRDRPDVVSPVRAVSGELGLRTMWIEDVDVHYGKGAHPYYSGRFSVVSQIREPLEDPTNRAIKRCFDLIFSFIGIVAVLPITIILVKGLQLLFSPGPLFYRQRRSGRNGENFEILKFRTMHVCGKDEFEQARPGDTRIYRGASFLRRFSIDELAQLLNVLRGEMSVVGPRPHPVELDERLSRESPVYRLRHLAKPGITGLAQSRGWRGETKYPSQLRNRTRLDLFYIQKWSLLLDIRILFETVVQVLRPSRSAV